MIKIYVPRNDEIRARITNEISGTEELDYTCAGDEYKFLKELSEDEFNALDIHSKEHETGNILVYQTGEVCILDGLGYLKIKFEPVD